MLEKVESLSKDRNIKNKSNLTLKNNVRHRTSSLSNSLHSYSLSKKKPMKQMSRKLKKQITVKVDKKQILNDSTDNEDNDVEEEEDGEELNLNLQQTLKILFVVLMIPSAMVVFFGNNKFKSNGNSMDASNLEAQHLASMHNIHGGAGPALPFAAHSGFPHFRDRGHRVGESSLKDRMNTFNKFMKRRSDDRLDDIEELLSSLKSDELKHENFPKQNDDQDSVNSVNIKQSIEYTPIYEEHSEHNLVKNVEHDPGVEHESHDSVKIILMWTKFFDSWDYVPNGSQPFIDEKCPINRCLFVQNRSLIKESDAIVFHSRDLVLYDLPNIRTPKQRWIFFCMEAPPYSYFNGFNFMSNMFNWTWTYRYDSDIRTSYGNIEPLTKPSQVFSVFDTWRNKNKMIFWLVSNCKSHSKREDYVNELKQYIDIDIYGECGENTCSKHSKDCFKNLAQQYLFAIVFENSNCRDYMSEKVFHALEHNVVPIVMSGANYSRIFAPNSVINALNFTSPKDLADYLLDIGSDFNKYKSFFDWKRQFGVYYNRNDLCDLCALLHNNSQQYKSYDNLNKWWVEDALCTQWQNTNKN